MTNQNRLNPPSNVQALPQPVAVATYGAPLQASYQRVGFGVFGVVGLVATVRFNAGDSAGLLFLLAAGVVASIAALVGAARTLRRSGSVQRGDTGLYVGFLFGAIGGVALLSGGAVQAWILPGLLLAAGLCIGGMARIESSTIGLTAALALAMLCALVGASQLSLWVTWTLLSISVMLLAAGFIVTREHQPRI